MESVLNPSRRTAEWPAWLLAAMLAAGLLAYANSLSGPFIFDDVESIPGNPHIRQLWPLSEAMSAPPRTSVSGRPVVCLSLAVNYAVGGLNPLGYHVFNLAIHLGSAFLLLGIIRRTLLATSWYGHPARQSTTPWLAAAAAAIWMLHPLQTEAVTYVIQRTELLMGLFYLLTLYCAILGWRSSRRGLWFAASVVACALGMGSKEAMVTAPLVVWLYDRTFVSRSWGTALRRHAGLYAGLAVTWLIVAWSVASGARTETVGLHLQISPLAYLATQAGVIVWYLRLCFWPDALVISYNGWPIAHRIVPILPQALSLWALLAGTAWGVWRRSALGFVGAWFFLILAPTSSVVPIVTEIAAERRMYLPLAAVVVLIVISAHRFLTAAFTRLALTPASASRVCAGLAIIVGGMLGSATSARNRDYRSAYAIWADTAAKRPGIAFAQFELGKALAEQDQAEEGIARYQEALRLDPEYADAHNNLANLLADRGQLTKAIWHYEEALRVWPDWAEAHNNLGTVLTSQGRLDEAVRHYTAALRQHPSMAQAHSNLGVALLKLGRTSEALDHLRAAVAALPDLAQPHANLGDALARQGQLDEAIMRYQEALRIDPDYTPARRALEAATAQRRPAGTH